MFIFVNIKCGLILTEDRERILAVQLESNVNFLNKLTFVLSTQNTFQVGCQFHTEYIQSLLAVIYIYIYIDSNLIESDIRFSFLCLKNLSLCNFFLFKKLECEIRLECIQLYSDVELLTKGWLWLVGSIKL